MFQMLLFIVYPSHICQCHENMCKQWRREGAYDTLVPSNLFQRPALPIAYMYIVFRSEHIRHIAENRTNV